MMLAERLKELQGHNVKIGGAVGFIYCGENFPELPEVLDEIAREEQGKMETKYLKAKRVYNEREARWAVQKENVKNDIELLKKAIEDAVTQKDMAERFIAKANRLLEIYRSSTEADKTTKLIKIKNRLWRKIRDIDSARISNRKRLRYRLTLYETMQTDEAKKRRFAAWKHTMESYKREVDSLKCLSKLEVVAERPSIMSRGERILIVDSTIEGPYWYDEEMDRDQKMQVRIRKATLKRDYGEYFIKI